jgi:hypothetical protein
MNTEQKDNTEQTLAKATTSSNVISLEEVLMQQLIDMKVEIFLNKSAQYLLTDQKNRAANFL